MRLLLAALFVYHGVNGLIMLFMPEFWYATVPDVDHTGPFNPHFVRDIGLGFITAAAGLGMAAWRPALSAALWPAAVFLGGHAGLHIVEMALHGISTMAGLRDGLIIVVPGLLPLVLAVLAARREGRA